MTVLEVRHLVKTYIMGNVIVNALNDINLSIDKGEFVAIMGPSGSGKSTLLHIVGGLDSPTSGEIILGGVPINQLSDDELTKLRRRKIGFIFQFFNLLPTLSARDNIILPILIDGRSPDSQNDYINSMIQLIGLADRMDHRPDQLSGGQQQRIAIARALISQPEMILADEPTGNLDSRSGASILELLRRACKEYQATIIMVTHDARAASFADRVIFLKDGSIESILVRDSESISMQRIMAEISRLEN